MEEIRRILNRISSERDCIVVLKSTPIEVPMPYELPADLRYYLENYDSISFFPNSEYPLTIKGVKGFVRANPILIGDEGRDDLSYNWFIIAQGGSSEYITVDLSKEHAGRCYDSFWDRHGLVGDQPVIAKSFTELLLRLFQNKGQYYYWLREDFETLGDAYEP